MTKALLLVAASAPAFAFASPAAARPMTATDMHMMHRLGTPEVSPDGKWAVFTISDTDLAAKKRNNTLYLLDLSKSGASPQPVTGAETGHDAVFGPDGALRVARARTSASCSSSHRAPHPPVATTASSPPTTRTAT